MHFGLIFYEWNNFIANKKRLQSVQTTSRRNQLMSCTHNTETKELTPTHTETLHLLHKILYNSIRNVPKTSNTCSNIISNSLHKPLCFQLSLSIYFCINQNHHLYVHMNSYRKSTTPQNITVHREMFSVLTQTLKQAKWLLLLKAPKPLWKALPFLVSSL